jgi:multisubunit Na+/H+ antiporter MnhB subunit
VSRGGLARIAVIVGGAISVWVALVAAVLALPLDVGLAEEAAASVDETGVTHPVTAVLLSYRAYDTWLEVVVVLAAVMAVLVVTQRAHVWDVSAPRRPYPLQGRFVHLLAPFLVLVGAYLVSLGTFTTGGAFQGATVLAAASLLVWLSGDSSPQGLRFDLSTALASSAHAAFVIVVVVTGVIGRPLAYRGELAGIVILAVEVLVTVALATSLALVFLGARASWEEP